MQITNFEAILIQAVEDNANNKDARREAVKAILNEVKAKGIGEDELWKPVLERAKKAVRGQ